MYLDDYNLKKVQEVFFAAMRQGWASGNDGEVVKIFPSLKQTQFEFEDKIIVTDRWGSIFGKSTGSTLITSASGLPLWAMWYGGGFYKKEAIPFLREVLMENYRKELFCGGRGPVLYHKDTLLYKNEFKGSFVQFSGTEAIYNLPGAGKVEPVGSHRYWGGSFLFLR